MRNVILKNCLIIFGLLINHVAGSQIKVACIGNSNTYGYGLPSPSIQSFPSILQDLLGISYEVYNFGVSGRCMLKNGDLPYWNEPEFTQALSLLPDVVIIMLGTNDSRQLNWLPYGDEFKDNYKEMIYSFTNLSSNPTIWTCQVVPAYSDMWTISDSIITNEVNPIIKEIAVEEVQNLIDMYTLMENHESWFQSDGIHPNETGAQEMANYIYNIILQDTLSIQRDGDMLIAPEAAGYQWYFNGQLINESEGGLEKELEADSVGIYQVGIQLSDSSQTTIISYPFNFETTSVKSLNDRDTELVRLYPNPCQDIITVKANYVLNQPYEFNIYNTNGKLLFSQDISKETEKTLINLQSFSSGLYIYQIRIKKEMVESGKVVINH